METSPSRRDGTGSIDADQPHAHNLLDVLRQLDINAGDRILGTTSGGKGWSGARLACKALRDFVDANLRSVELCWTWNRAMKSQPPGAAQTGFTSPVARFRRCSLLSITFKRDEEDANDDADEDDADEDDADEDDADEDAVEDTDEDVDSEHGDAIQHPALLASLCVAGVSADVARNITELRLKLPLDLPSLVTVAVVLAGTLRHVRILALGTQPCGIGRYGFYNMHALHTRLRAAFPALEGLNLPARPCLRDLEAFAGSSLHTVRVMADSPGILRMSHVRSLVQLPQLRQLDLDGEDWGTEWGGDDYIWDDEDDHVGYDKAANSPAGAALRDASDDEAFHGMFDEDVEELLTVRRLLVSPPPALERLRWPGRAWLEVGFTGGRITCVDLHEDDLHHAALVLLPVLAATGRRLPLLKVRFGPG